MGSPVPQTPPLVNKKTAERACELPNVISDGQCRKCKGKWKFFILIQDTHSFNLMALESNTKKRNTTVRNFFLRGICLFDVPFQRHVAPFSLEA